MAAEPYARAALRAKIIQLWAEGVPQTEIARRLDTTRTVVYRAICIVRKYWQKTAKQDFERHVADLLPRYGEIYSKAMDSFNKSKGVVTKTKKKKRIAKEGNEDAEIAIEEHNEAGDPRFLEQGQRALERMARLVGADKPIKHAWTDSQGNDLPIQIVEFHGMAPRKLTEGQEGDIPHGGDGGESTEARS